LNIQILQDSPASDLKATAKWLVLLQLLLIVKELAKSVHISQSYHENNSGTFSKTGVYIDL